MRKAWIGGGFVLVAVIGFGLSTGSTRAQPAAGAGADTHRKVTVSGTATVAVKPDTARVSFAVKGHGNDFKSAVADCDKKAGTVLKAIDELKIPGLEIKKGPLNLTQAAGGFGMPPLIGPGGPPPMGIPGGVAPPPPPPPLPGAIPPMALPGGVDVLFAAQPPVVAQPAVPQPAPLLPPPMGGPGGFPGGGWGGAFEVTRTFTVIATFGKEGGAGKLEDIVSVADKLLTAAVSAGATDAPTFTTPGQPQFGLGGGGMNTPNRTEFYRANVAALRQEAIKLAVADALANAKVATGAANITAKEIVSITDQTQTQFGAFGMQGQATNTGRGEVQGDAELTVTLSVTFSY